MTSTSRRASRAASPPSTRSRARCSGRASSARSTRAACRCRRASSASPERRSTTRPRGYVYVAATDKLWALDVHTGGRARAGPCRSRSTRTTSTCGAPSLSATGTSTSASPRTAIAVPTAGACSPSRRRPLRSTTPGRRSTPRRQPGGGGIWGWGGIAITADGHVWAASRERQHLERRRRVRRSRGVGRRAELVARAAQREPRARHARPRRLRLRLDARSSSTSRAAARWSPSEGKDGAVYLWQRAQAGRRPVQRLELAFPATLYGSPAWDPGRSSSSSRPRRATRASPRARRARADQGAGCGASGRRASVASSAPCRPSPTTRCSSPRAPATCVSTPPPRAGSSPARAARRGLLGAHRVRPRRRRRDLDAQAHGLPPARREVARGGSPGALSCPAWPFRSISPPSPAARPSAGTPARLRAARPRRRGARQRAALARDRLADHRTVRAAARERVRATTPRRRSRSPSPPARPRCTSRCARSASARATATR